MYIKLNLKPTVMKAHTKSELLYKIESGYVHTYALIKGVRIHALMEVSNPKHVRVYNLEKHNRKMEQYFQRGEKHSRMKNPLYWRAYVYDIPIELLTIANLSVFQENRTFKLVNREHVNTIKYQLDKL